MSGVALGPLRVIRNRPSRVLEQRDRYRWGWDWQDWIPVVGVELRAEPEGLVLELRQPDGATSLLLPREAIDP